LPQLSLDRIKVGAALFDSIGNLTVWIWKDLSGHQFGLFLDSMNIYEDINEMVRLVDTPLKTMELVKKLSLHSTREAMSVTSMQNAVQSAWGGDRSGFPLPRVPKFEKWSCGSTDDFKSKLKLSIMQVYPEIQQAIWADLSGLPAASLLASECLTQTICFVMELHTFIDSPYMDMVASGFTPKDSWNLACSLVSRTFRYLVEARTGAQNPVAGNTEALATNCLWAILQTV